MHRAIRYRDGGNEPGLPPSESETLTLMRRVVPSARERGVAEPVLRLPGMVGQSDAMRDVQRRLERVAATDVPVLLTGESGTGKGLAARALHAMSPRRDHAFVRVNCSALPPDALDEELFGASHGGVLESTRGGTVLLEEIGDLSAVSQARLLWLLEHREIVRAGGATSRGVNVRILVTSHRVLDRLVAEGKFRDDLLYRLRIVTLHLPPLRDRAGDLTLLIEHFVRGFSAQHGLPVREFDHLATSLLQRHMWPGNVRELRNVIESALLLADGPLVTVRELPRALNARAETAIQTAMSVASGADLTFVEARERALREFDRAFLRAALERHGGNVARTARALGLHRQSLQKLLVRRELRLPNEGLHAS